MKYVATIVRYLPLVALVVLMASCRSKKEMVTDAPTVVTPTPSTRTERGVEAIAGKLNLKLSAGNKSVKVGGSYRLKRDKVVQINLVYTVLFLPVNVGTLELTPDYVLVLDRINKRYCRVKYSDVPSLQQEGITFDTLQKAFWGESEERTKGAFQYRYSNWTDLSHGRFPQTITVMLKSGRGSYQALFDIQNIRETGDWDEPTEVPAGYSAVSMESVMSAIMSVAK
ncbi:MAG: DUF4292 domain-containing protein [Bacteroidaceae bacterium]|nr:DUF4292 domain-containing protein [Bacteroidaceae bacterium]